MTFETICPRCIALERMAMELDEEATDLDRMVFAETDIDLIAHSPYRFCARHALDACSACGDSRDGCTLARLSGKGPRCCVDCNHSGRTVELEPPPRGFALLIVVIGALLWVGVGFGLHRCGPW